MAVTRFISGELDDSKRRDMIFRGEFVLFKGVPSMKLLCERADFLAREAFGAGIEPELAHHHYAREDYLAIVDSGIGFRCAFNPAAARILKWPRRVCTVIAIPGIPTYRRKIPGGHLFIPSSRAARLHITRGISTDRSQTIRKAGILANFERLGRRFVRAMAPARK